MTRVLFGPTKHKGFFFGGTFVSDGFSLSCCGKTEPPANIFIGKYFLIVD